MISEKCVTEGWYKEYIKNSYKLWEKIYRQPNEEMCKRLEQTLHKRQFPNGIHENIFNTMTNQENGK